MAIENSPTKAMPVKDIYSWISNNFPFYKDAPDGWKNTVRHNLSLSKCFYKIEKGKKLKDATTDEEKELLNEQLASKGSLWCVDPKLRPNLLNSIKKTPAHIYPYMSTVTKTDTNLAQISNIINSTNDKNRLPNGPNSKNVNQIVTVSNTNISPSNSQSPTKIITLNKLPHKTVLATTKQVLIPVVKKKGRELEEAAAAESMLTLTQCSTAGNASNGNIMYIITNNKGNNLVPIQLNKPVVVSPTKQQTSPVKNQIAILTQPVIRAPQQNQPKTVFAIKPVTTLAPTTVQKDQPKIITILPQQIKLNTTSSQSTDHNYSSSKNTIATTTIRTMNNNNNMITIPASALLPRPSVTGQTQTRQVLVTTTKSTTNSPLGNKNISRIITILPPGNKLPTATNNIQIIKTLPKPADISSKKSTATVNSTTTNKKQKVDTNDEDGLKCAEALFNLANGSNTTTNANAVKLKTYGKGDKRINAEKSNDKSTEKTNEKATDETSKSTKKRTIEPTKTPIKATITITRSAAKKLKTTA